MMILKKLWFILPVLCVYMLLALICILLFANTQRLWLLNVFSDWFLAMLMMPVFTACTLAIGKSMTIPRILRMESRYASICAQRTEQFTFGVGYLTMWFLMILLVEGIRFGPLTEISFGKLLDAYLRYLLTMLLFINIAIVLQHSSVPLFASSAYALLYCFFVADLLAISPTLDKLLPLRGFFLVFSWVSADSPVSYIALTVMNAIALWIHKHKTAYADLL